jgi:hypothetical protein
MLQGIGRSSTVIIGGQIREFLSVYFSLGELLSVVLSVHVLLCVMPRRVSGFNASWDMICSLMQSISVQLVVPLVSNGEYGALNLIGLLMVAESLPVFSGFVGDDVASLATTISFTFSDEVSVILKRRGVPLVGAALGIAFGGTGIFGQTMMLTGVNCVCDAVFGALSGGELSFAWPVLLLYFVSEVSDRFDRVKPYVDYGLYRASDAMFVGFGSMNIPPHVIALAFTFLGLALPTDPVWTGVCALVLVQSSSTWFIDGIKRVSYTDPVLAGLCIVTAVHFVCLGIQVLCRRTPS